jgi:hypothetical protein
MSLQTGFARPGKPALLNCHLSSEFATTIWTTEGFDALQSEREGKLTPRTFKAKSKPAPVVFPQEGLQVHEQLHLGKLYRRETCAMGIPVG